MESVIKTTPYGWRFRNTKFVLEVIFLVVVRQLSGATKRKLKTQILNK